MTIETKYNIGDEVRVVKGDRARVGHIQSLCFHQYLLCVGYVFTRISYDVSCEGECLYDVDEIDLFPTKEELIKSL